MSDPAVTGPSASAAPRGPGTAGFPAFVVRRGDDDVSAGVEELGLDDLPPGEVLIAVSWSSVNYKDGMVTVPGNRVARASPLVPGVDLAGVVVESADPALGPGTEVLAHGGDLGVARHGGYAGYARVGAGCALPIPDGLTARQAMAIGTAGFTAALSLDQLERRGLRPGDGPVLVTGASGGVGSFALDLLAGRGYEVVASTGKADEHAWLQSLGAAEVIGRDEVDEAGGRVLGPEHWAGAVDCVGGETLGRVLQALRYGAAVAASGLTGGTALETTVYPFITRGVALLGVDSVRTPMERRREVWGRLATDLRPAHLEDVVAGEVPLEGVAGALSDILAARVRGRVLVRIGAAS
ncbi:MAG TPA: acryloyl-CoA reductase [Acidimicrobiales bacterium]|nr:acryloyl-CoA reductase [Acidimicrobiales bacterium]